MIKNSILWLAVIAIVIISGYYAYTYLKEKPPAVLVDLVTKTNPPPPLPQGDEAPLIMQDGYSATIFARDVGGARVMIRDPKGTMLLSQTSQGRIVALPDLDQDGIADRTVVVLENLDRPHGILVHCDDTGSQSADQDSCILYVAETGELTSYRYDADLMTAQYIETLTTFPTGDGHHTRTLLLHPDQNRLLISVGSSCNVCVEEDARRAAVLSYDLSTKEVTTFATGLRNTVFMAIEPATQKIWGTDNGRDLIGDDIPPDEVNIIEQGKDYGWPFCYGRNVYDTDFGRGSSNENPCNDTVAPHIELQAHSAALGLAFIPHSGWPEDMQGDLLIAYHGSWNRTEPTGYKVVRFELDADQKVTSGPIDFMTGFITTSDTDDAIGRPVGILAEEGGVAYVSDDRAGAVYRIDLQQ